MCMWGFQGNLHKCADLYQDPIPQIIDLHALLRGCEIFSILDMSPAYHQIPLAKECQPYFTINIHVGMSAFTGLPNGLHSRPAVFQQVLYTVQSLVGIPHVILVAGIDEEDHLCTLSIVFQKLLDAGFHLNKSRFKLQ